MTATTDTRPQHADLPLDQVHIHPRNARRELRDMDQMTASVKESGVLQDVVVAPQPHRPDEPVWWLVMGHRRVEAARRAGLPTVPARIRWDLTGEVDILAAMAQENLQRDDYTLIEEGILYEQLSMRGLSDSEIGRRTGRPAGTVTRRRQLLDLPDKTKDRIQARQLTLDQADALLEFADDPAEIRTLERALEAESHNGFAYEVARARGRRETAAKRARVAAELAASGIDVIDHSPEWGQRLRTIFDIPHGQDEPKVWQVDRGGITAHTETGCTARLVAWISLGGWVAVGCTDPIHAKDEPGEDQPGQPHGQAHAGVPAEVQAQREQADAERRARAEQAEQDRRDCDAAREVRQAYVRSFVTGEKKITAAMRDAIIRHIAVTATYSSEVFGGLDNGVYAHWLGLDVDDVEAEDDVIDAVQKALNKMKDPIRALLAATAAGDEEEQLHNPHGWTPMRLRTDDPWGASRWLQLVGGPLGYEWTPWEAERIAAADQQDAEATS